VALAVSDTARSFRLPRPAFAALLDARVFDLYNDPMPTLNDLEGYCGETSSSLLRLGSLVLAGGSDPGGTDACGHGGVAYALAGLLRALPWHAARGQVYLPADVLGRHGISAAEVLQGRQRPELSAALSEIRQIARKHLAAALRAGSGMDVVARPVLAPLALVEPYLRRMEGREYEPFRSLVQLPQWRRQWALWRMSGILGRT
jgi:phytoene synthase